MDPLSALAVAAAVFQFLDLGGKALMKAWDKYKQMQQGTPDDQKLAEEEEELRRALKDLTTQISWIRDVLTNMLASEPPTPAQARLKQLSSQCISLSNDFESIKHQMKPPSSREIRSTVHQRNAELDRNSGDIERISGRLESLRRNVIDYMLLCLWYVLSI
jgi:chromosome segregation ATPase